MKRRIKGTDVYLAIICAMVIFYVVFFGLLYKSINAWPPAEITVFYFIVPIYEIYSLLRVRMVKEGEVDEHGIIKDSFSKVKTWINGKSPIELPDTEIDVEIAKNQIKESIDEQINEP